MEPDKSRSESNVISLKTDANEVSCIDVEPDIKVTTKSLEESNHNDESSGVISETFKKPALLIGPRRGKVGQIRSITVEIQPVVPQAIDENPSEVISVPESEEGSEKVNSVTEKTQHCLAYKEPTWGGKPGSKYQIEVLKSGVILDSIDLTKKSFHVIGRLPICDIPLAHPTISRYHAVIQYRAEGNEKNGPGLYLYDLESTHGTFWNSCRIKPRTYVRLHGGHMIKFGCSQRKFIIQTPSDEEEEESEYSVTELKEMRRLELQQREKEEKERREEDEEFERLRKVKEEEEGISWGMTEDADEETDLTENPYALTNNEELFLDDPKKTLRGWFEREGYDLQYQTEEKGVGQFLCWVELPVDSVSGKKVRAEALVKGKKKEAVIQCALEACRILDRQGLLRQANHEGRKRKSRNWEDDDYYDSDEDNFLDRTGAVERKREQRMRNAGKLEAKVETYGSLLQKHSKVVEELTKIQVKLTNHQKTKDALNANSGEDELDAFMSNLSCALLNKADITKLKVQLQNLKKEEESLKKLIDITKPANLPSLNIPSSTDKESDSTPEKRTRIDTDDEKPRKVHYGLLKNIETATENAEAIDDVEDTLELELAETKSDDDNDEKVDESMEKQSQVMKKKKRNVRRMQSRADKVAKERQKGYDEIVYKEDYSMWVPPSNQEGDGKTNLNDKFGY